MLSESEQISDRSFLDRLTAVVSEYLKIVVITVAGSALTFTGISLMYASRSDASRSQTLIGISGFLSVASAVFACWEIASSHLFLFQKKKKKKKRP